MKLTEEQRELILKETEYLEHIDKPKDFINDFNTKYNTNITYIQVYHFLKSKNMVHKLINKEHNKLEQLLTNEKLLRILNEYSGEDLCLKNILDIVKSAKIKCSYYMLQKVIKILDLDFKTKPQYNLQERRLSDFQKRKLQIYCKEQNIDIKHVTYQELRKLYEKFKYNYLADLLFEMVQKKIN